MPSNQHLRQHTLGARRHLDPCGTDPFVPDDERKYFAVIDTETTGLKRANGRIVEIGIAIYAYPPSIGADPVAHWSSLIKPDGFTIPEEATGIHHITTEDADAHGINISDAFNMVDSILRRANLLIGHNLQFDIWMIASEIRHIGEHTISEQLCSIPRFDTCDISRDLWGRRISLSLLYQMATCTPIINAHRVNDDIRMTAIAYAFIIKNQQDGTTARRITIPVPSSEQQHALQHFIDGRNFLDKEEMISYGFNYSGIGR